MSPSEWQRISAALSYQLGEIGLFTVRFDGIAYRRHFSTVGPFTRLPEPPPDAGEESFVFFPSYPIAFKPRPITRSGPWLAYTPYTFRSFYIDLRHSGSFDAYLKSFSSKSRSTLQRKVKKFAEASGGTIRWSSYRTPEEIEAFFALARSLSSKTYQERLLDSGLPEDPHFRARAVKLAASGGARGFLLFFDGKAIAYVFAFCHDRIMTYDYVGYDPDARSLSPGTVLQYLIFEALFAEREVDVFDFTEGEGQQKALFATHERLCAKTYFFKPSLRHTALAYSHHALNRVVQATGGVLERLGLKDALRNLIRRSA